MKRSACLAAALLVVGLPVVSGAQAGEEVPGEVTANGQVLAAERRERPRSCKIIANQIARYENVVVMARERGDERWEEGTLQHIERLRGQQRRRCPKDVPPSAGEKMMEVLEAAARATATAATLGAL